jgi:hypothetical protein
MILIGLVIIVARIAAHLAEANGTWCAPHRRIVGASDGRNR